MLQYYSTDMPSAEAEHLQGVLRRSPLLARLALRVYYPNYLDDEPRDRKGMHLFMSEYLPLFPQLTYLDLSFCSIHDEKLLSYLAKAMETNPHSLTDLLLAGNGFQHIPSDFLAQLSVHSSLRRLDFSQNRLSNYGALTQALSECPKSALTSLNIRSHHVEESFDAILAPLSKISSLTELITSCNADSQSVKNLDTVSTFFRSAPALQRLEFRGYGSFPSPADQDDASSSSSPSSSSSSLSFYHSVMCGSASLRELTFHETRPSLPVLKAFVKHLPSSSLTSLCFTDCHLTAPMLLCLGEALASSASSSSCSLHTLYLNRNMLSDEMMKPFMKLLRKYPKLKNFEMQENYLSQKCITQVVLPALKSIPGLSRCVVRNQQSYALRMEEFPPTESDKKGCCFVS
jgi:hypothetical protein